MIWARAAVVAAILCCAAGRAEAACTISATAVTFGIYNVFTASNTDSTGSVTYRCGNADRRITITISRGSSSTFSPRTLRKGTEPLNYNLYRNATYTQIWGDGSAGTSTFFINNPPNNQDIVLTVYGRIPAVQDVSVGSYTDAVVATIEY